MSIFSQTQELEEVIGRWADNMLFTVSSQTGELGAELRRQIGDVRANLISMVVDETLPDKLLGCYQAANLARVKLPALVNVRNKLWQENAQGNLAKAVVQSLIVMCLSAESRIIITMTFKSRDDIEVMMGKMKVAFDTAKEMAADQMDSISYQKLTYLAGSVARYLSVTAKPLPRMVNIRLTRPMPALTASQLIYRQAGRWEELVDENKVVHPAFCRVHLRGLSK